MEYGEFGQWEEFDEMVWWERVVGDGGGEKLVDEGDE